MEKDIEAIVKDLLCDDSYDEIGVEEIQAVIYLCEDMMEDIDDLDDKEYIYQMMKTLERSLYL